jgi:O-methyltransferase involved in polyketide biosynthesis
MRQPKIRVNDEVATYLATLYGKALDAAAADSILGDRFAAEAVARLEYDFAALKAPKGSEITLPIRAKHFDQWTRAFLARNPAATVLHLGCGLDTRVQRLDPGPEVRWFDIDFPHVIALREELYPAREGYRMIGASVLDPAWLGEVPRDQPVLVVAEGLVMYLDERDGTALLRRITEHFPSGEIAFDAYKKAMVRLVSRLATVRGAKVDLVWGIEDPREIEEEVPALHLVESVEFLAMPELVERLAKNRASAVMYGVLRRLRFYRTLVRHLRYAFAGR